MKNPGPSDYKIPSIFGSSKKTMAVMMQNSSRLITLKNFRKLNPGVGDYDIANSLDFTMSCGPSHKIGSSHRESIKESSKM